MKILVLGGGVVGVTAAYFLAANGHEVEVVERGQSAATETSFANGGQLSYSHAEPWANPSVLPKVLKWLFKKDAPLIFRPRADLDMIAWGLKFLANCTTARAHANSVSILRLGLFSKKKTEQLRSVTGVAFDNIREGILHIFTHPEEYAHAIEQSRYQEKFGCHEDILDTAACIRMEPALEHAGQRIVGGIHAPLDESGDAYLFSLRLAELCAREYGARFHYDTSIQKLNKGVDGRIASVTTGKGDMTADAYVMSMGSYSPLLLRKVGINVPIYPMKGYSITLPANIHTPTISITDTERKLVYSRLGNRLRIAGTAEFAGYDTRIHDYRIAPLLRAVKSLFPKCDHNITHQWACLRPTTPDGPPIIGASPIPNLYLNTGHGTLGWTQAAGSAALLADIIDGRPTEIAMNGLTIERYL